jgi:hypothetical protein
VVLLLLPAAMFVYSSRGRWFFPPLLWSFPPSATLTSFPTPGCWACAPTPARASPASLACLFTVPGRSPLPAIRHSGCPTLFAKCLYCSYWLLLSFSFFPRWRSVCPQGCALLAQGCLWEYHVLLISPCLPKPSGCGRLAAQGPSWFLHLMWSGDFLHQLEVWRGQSFASSWWFCLQDMSPVSLQDFTIGGMFLLPLSSRHLGIPILIHFWRIVLLGIIFMVGSFFFKFLLALWIYYPILPSCSWEICWYSLRDLHCRVFFSLSTFKFPSVFNS